jgi:hypothetical protein
MALSQNRFTLLRAMLYFTAIMAKFEPVSHPTQNESASFDWERSARTV